MQRHTTIEVDLALLGGQNPSTARQLSWSAFLEHWKQVLPTRQILRWDLSQHRAVWETVAVAPPEWSALLWPDFHADPDPAKNKTLMHMALHDACQKDASAKDAAEALVWLLKAGVSPNVWPGNGSSVIAQICLKGKANFLKVLIEHGVDIQCTITGPSRPEFQGSNLLFRVGPSVASLAHAHLKKLAASNSTKTSNFAQLLRLLVEHMPDPNAPTARGQTALGAIGEKYPAVADDLRAVMARSREHMLVASLGLEESSPRFAELWEKQLRWASKAVSSTGSPVWLVPEPVDPFQERDWPRAFRVVSVPEPGAVVARAMEPTTSRTPLDAQAAFEKACQAKADAVVEKTREGVRWWVFHPRQLRAAIAPLPTPAVRARQRL